MNLQSLTNEWLSAYLELVSADSGFDAMKIKRLSDENLMTAVELFRNDMVNGNELSAFIEYVDYHYNHGKTYDDFKRNYLGTATTIYGLVHGILGLILPSWIIIDEELTLINIKKRYLVSGNHYFIKENNETT